MNLGQKNDHDKAWEPRREKILSILFFLLAGTTNKTLGHHHTTSTNTKTSSYKNRERGGEKSPQTPTPDPEAEVTGTGLRVQQMTSKTIRGVKVIFYLSFTLVHISAMAHLLL